jgi:uncharacterized protein YicC (UPF0701 family)
MDLKELQIRAGISQDNRDYVIKNAVKDILEAIEELRGMEEQFPAELRDMFFDHIDNIEHHTEDIGEQIDGQD